MGQHWYCSKTGEPRYKIPYANGKGEKTPTLADAKRCGFVPSVTSVLQILDRPGLNRWQQEQMILAALTHPAISELTHEEMMRVIRQDAQEQARAAAERGTAIHDLLERFYTDGYFPMGDDTLCQIVMGVDSTMDYNEACGPWVAEARLPGGLPYGGKCDLHNDEWLIDFKTKEFTKEDIEAGNIKGWPEQEVQLVAYDHGFGGPRRKLANVFVSVTEPGLCHFHEWPPEGYDAALRKWLATLECWFAWKDSDGKLREHVNG